MAFATPEELARWLSLPDFTGDDATRAQLLLDGATGVIVTEADQELGQSTQTVTLDGTGTDTLVLPRWPVISVASVVEDGDTLTEGEDEDYTTRLGEGLLIREDDDVWDADHRVKVEFSAGYATIPDALKRVTLEMAARSWRNPVGLTSESIGDWSASWAVPGMAPTAAERRIIAHFSKAS